jgi:hypothetical protein
MPLPFESLSHGVVAFGFFNIESDMLLLEQEFFFADDFCGALVELASTRDSRGVAWDGYHIADRNDVGDLMGAIHGVRHTGFIGETYRRFPFPARPEEFEQKPDGDRNREEFAELVLRFGQARRMRLDCDPDNREVSLAGVRFTRDELQRLVDYVWLGGYPRWRDGVRPGCVARMAEAVRGSTHWLFGGIRLTA